MSTKLDDVHLSVRLDVKGLSRDADKLDRRVKEKERRRGRQRDQKERRKKTQGRWVPGARGAATDIIRGRAPGLGRFGGAAMKVAGFLAFIKGIELLATAASEAPVLGALARPVARGIKEGSGQLTAGIKALEETKDAILSRKFTGKGPEDTGEFFEKRRKAHALLGKADIARDLLAGPEMPLIILEALKGMLAAAGSAFVKEIVGIIKDAFFDDEDVDQKVEEKVEDYLNKTRGNPAAGGFR